MDPLRVWPDFRDDWVLFEDADVIAIDKPVGVSSQAADPTSPDDVVTRLKRHLAARSGVSGLASFVMAHRLPSGSGCARRWCRHAQWR